MSAQYSRDLIKVSVAKMLQTIGWHSIQTAPLEILTDMMIQYITQMGKLTNDYSNEFGCTEPNLDHLGLAFRDFLVNLPELEEYVTYVDFAQAPTSVPKYPILKEDHLNFLKPGSKEVVTRPVHIHEHLPPMFAIQEASETENEIVIKKEDIEDSITEGGNAQVFKRPLDISPGESFKRPRLLMEEEGRPTREISSVMMTTSGYISPAREGKLPESRTPQPSLETAPMVNSVSGPSNQGLKPNKIIKKVEKKKEKVGKELFKPIDDKPPPAKKIPSMKDVAKLKQAKSGNNMNVTTNATAAAATLPVNFLASHDVKLPPIPTKPPPINNKVNKALAAARLKTEKLNTTITPIPIKPTAPPNDNVDKLFTEPDKKKVNIFKKITNVKNDKLESKIMKIKEDKQESRESSPVLIIDETIEQPLNKVHISNDLTIELVDNKVAVNKVPEKTERPFFYDDSPPGTPLTPKTPEMITHSPPIIKEKRKRKDKSKVKKVQKLMSPNRQDIMDIDIPRPKTPEAQIENHESFHQKLPATMPFPFPFPTFGPGLIPSMSNPLFSTLPMPLPLPRFGNSAFMPPLHPPPSMHMVQPPIKPEEPVPLPRPKTPIEKPQPVLQPPPITPPVLVVDVEEPPKPEKKIKEHKKEKKDKIKKKNKKDKVKDKAEKKKLKEEKKDKEKVKKEKKEKKKDKEFRENDVSILKLTFKLGSSSPRPETPDTRKLTIKPIIKKEEEEECNNASQESNREMSPELAKISALVTGQPKPKSTNHSVAIISNDIFASSSTDSFHNQMKKPMFKPIPKKEVKKEPIDVGLINTTPSSYIHDKQEEESLKEETPVVGPPPRTGAGPGRPRIHPIKPKPTKPNKQQVPVKDSEGNKVWICPGCGRQDDGSPMIGCDDCDAWYHWVCVGIQVPPDDSEDWYCRHCIVKKQEVLQTDKKKKRKKREKKEH